MTGFARLFRTFLAVLACGGLIGGAFAGECLDGTRITGGVPAQGDCDLSGAAREDIVLLKTEAGGRGLDDGDSLRALASNADVKMDSDSVGLAERFVAWLRQVLSTEDEQSAWPAWLKDWLGEVTVSTSAVQLIYYAVLVLLGSFVAWFLIREIRAVRRDRFGTPVSGGVGPVDDRKRGRVLSPDAIARLAPEQRPAAWVIWAVAALARHERLERARAWTNHEIAGHLERQRPELAPVFRRLAVRADAVTFGGQPADRKTLDGAESEARELVGRLSGAAS